MPRSLHTEASPREEQPFSSRADARLFLAPYRQHHPLDEMEHMTRYIGIEAIRRPKFHPIQADGTDQAHR